MAINTKGEEEEELLKKFSSIPVSISMLTSTKLAQVSVRNFFFFLSTWCQGIHSLELDVYVQ